MPYASSKEELELFTTIQNLLESHPECLDSTMALRTLIKQALVTQPHPQIFGTSEVVVDEVLDSVQKHMVLPLLKKKQQEMSTKLGWYEKHKVNIDNHLAQDISSE